MTQTQAQHTPGPWKQMEHAPLAIMGGPSCHVSVADAVALTDEGQAAANARLIAAAPDLLAACDLTIGTIEAMRELGESTDSLQTVEWQARKALAKARAAGTRAT